MTASIDSPDTDLAYDLYFSGVKAQLVRLSLILDVFSPLATGPASAEEVAVARGCDPKGTGLLLDYLVALGVLRREIDRYALTVTASTFLVPESPAYAGDVMLTFTQPATWDGIHDAIRSASHIELESERDHVQDAWIESHSEWRLTSAREMWARAGVAPEQDASLDLLDIACGCAIKTFALAQARPMVRVTCLDRPAVLGVARDLAARMGVLAQVDFLTDDLRTADLGHALHDACLLGQITHYLTTAENQDLFGRAHAALRPGGTLVIDAPMLADPPGESTALLSVLLWASGGSTAYPFEAYRDWLDAAGFRHVRQLGERWLAANRAT